MQTEKGNKMIATEQSRAFDLTAEMINEDRVFRELVRDGLTQSELRDLIERRPQTYSRFSQWIDALPRSKPIAQRVLSRTTT